MIPGITAVRMTGAGRESLPLLVLGPSLGTSASGLWARAAVGLTDAFDVVAWDLPGHGHNRAALEDDFTLAELATGVLAVVDDILAHRGEEGGPFFVAGDSVGGAVAVQLMLDAPSRIRSAAALCVGARSGSPESWQERIKVVQAGGTVALTESLSQKWFGPEFLDREPEMASALLGDLAAADDAGYAAVCRALAQYDVTDRLEEITAPLLVVAGAEDLTAPPAGELATAVAGARFESLEGVGHLAPAEAPDAVAALLREHFLGEPPAGTAGADRSATDLTDDFWEFLTDHARGGAGDGDGRPGLDPRSRSLITLTALVARGHHEDLPKHLHAAITNGVTQDEIRELLLQTALYCGVPDANTAFRIAQEAFAGHR